MPVSLMPLAVLVVTCLAALSTPTPVLPKDSHQKASNKQLQPPSTSSLASSTPSHNTGTSPSTRVRGVWPVTKAASLLGPTIAIFLYDQAHNLYERYQPFISAAVIDFVQHLRAAVQSPYIPKPLVWLSSVPSNDPSDTNPRVTAITNEVIRQTNLRLREHAVVSRIQMDDDQYEFSKSLSAEHVKDTALRVMHSVLTNGSGRYLQPEEKIAVHALIASSVY